MPPSHDSDQVCEPTNERETEQPRPTTEVAPPEPASIDRMIAGVAAAPANGAGGLDASRVPGRMAGPTSGRPNLELTEQHLELGRVEVGQTRSTKLSVINREPHAIDLGSCVVTGSSAVTATIVGQRIEPGDYAVVSVQVSPRAAGSIAAQVHVTTANGEAVMLPVNAIAVERPVSVAEATRGAPGTDVQRPLRWGWPGPLKLSAALGKHRDASVQIINDDDSSQGLQGVGTTGSNAFSVVEMSHASVPAKGAATVRVRFSPTSDVIHTGSLAVTTDHGGGIAKELIGEGTIEPRVSTSLRQAS